ncbi:MAG: hypothetical protein ACFE9L_10065 [Candidatus Hodarchaeota archaeon]
MKIISQRNKENFPHIIITDFKMPRMDGITFYNQLFSQYNDLRNYFVVVFYSGCAEGVLEDQTEELFRNIKGLIRYKPYNVFSLIDDAILLLQSK